MSSSRWCLVLLGLCLGACRIETHEDGDGPFDDEECGSEKSEAQSPDAAGCTRDLDCATGTYCDVELAHCVATPSIATCSELDLESDCVARADCAPIYAGVDCSCGADCACQGGEPGCVCQSFEFFRCEAAAL